jgi:hypothetical protein
MTLGPKLVALSSRRANVRTGVLRIDDGSVLFNVDGALGTTCSDDDA